MDVSPASSLLLGKFAEVAVAVALKKNSQRRISRRKVEREARKSRPARRLREQTSTWRFSSSVKSHGSLVWRSASATKISSSGSRDGVAFTRIAIERLSSGHERFPRLSPSSTVFFIHILVPPVPHLFRSPLSHRLHRFSLPSSPLPLLRLSYPRLTPSTIHLG